MGYVLSIEYILLYSEYLYILDRGYIYSE